jgi:2'-5' RNA ligase
MIRLFVGLELPEPMRRRLALLSGGVPGARWISPENFHLTVRFIGEVDEGRFEDIDAALARVKAPAFELTLEGVATFEKANKPHTLWVGVRRNESLNALHAKVDRALIATELEPEGRKYSPHVTLARLKGQARKRLGVFVAANALFRCGPEPIEAFVLFSSFLSRGGSIYHAEARYPLEPG